MIKAKTENHYCVKTSDWGNLSRLVDNFQGFKMACFQPQSWIALPVLVLLFPTVSSEVKTGPNMTWKLGKRTIIAMYTLEAAKSP